MKTALVMRALTYHQNLQSSLGDSLLFCYATCHFTALMKSKRFGRNIRNFALSFGIFYTKSSQPVLSTAIYFKVCNKLYDKIHGETL